MKTFVFGGAALAALIAGTPALAGNRGAKLPRARANYFATNELRA